MCSARGAGGCAFAHIRKCTCRASSRVFSVLVCRIRLQGHVSSAKGVQHPSALWGHQSRAHSETLGVLLHCRREWEALRRLGFACSTATSLLLWRALQRTQPRQLDQQSRGTCCEVASSGVYVCPLLYPAEMCGKQAASSTLRRPEGPYPLGYASSAWTTMLKTTHVLSCNCLLHVKVCSPHPCGFFVAWFAAEDSPPLLPSVWVCCSAQACSMPVAQVRIWGSSWSTPLCCLVCHAEKYVHEESEHHNARALWPGAHDAGSKECEAHPCKPSGTVSQLDVCAKLRVFMGETWSNANKRKRYERLLQRTCASSACTAPRTPAYKLSSGPIPFVCQGPRLITWFHSGP